MIKKYYKGQEVEVTSSEPGFEESWYVANVVRRSKKKKYLVEYRNLVQEADSNKKLKESVEFGQLRPLPPKHDNNTPSSFQLNQVVDAFLNDGWWKGVIAKVVVEASRYAVFFKPSGEEKEFNHSDLRIHLDWIRGKWVLPPSPDQEAVVIAQNEANIQSPEPTGNSALRKGRATPQTPSGLSDVGCESALSSSRMTCGERDDQSPPNGTCSSSDALISSQEKRKESDPKTSTEGARRFMEVREGEAAKPPTFIETNDGKVASIEGPANGHGFFPTIEGKRDAMVLGDSEIIDFLNPCDQRQKRQNIDLLRGQVKELSPGTEKKQQVGGGGSPIENVLKRKRGRPFGSGRKFKRGRRTWSVMFQSKGRENESACKTSYTPLSSCNAEEHQHLSTLEEKFNSEMEKEVRGTKSEPASKKKTDVQTGCTPFSSGIAEAYQPISNLPAKSSSHLEKEVRDLENEYITQEMTGPENESSINEMTDVQPALTPLSSHIAEDYRPLSTFRKKFRSRMVKDIGGVVDRQIVDVLKRKRGRPKGSNQKSSERAPGEENGSKGLAGVASEEIAGVQVEWTSSSSNFAQAHPPTFCDKLNGGTEHEPGSARTAVQTESTQLLNHASERENGGVSPNNAAKDNFVPAEPLNVVGSVDDRALPLAPNGRHQYDSVSVDDRALPLAVEGALVPQEHGPLAAEDGSLPFIKSSDIWGLFESMEVFRSMPQRPHFRPLEKYNEDLREGYAIGNMLNFSNLVDRTWKAQFDDPMSMFESKLKALADLEDLGFNVDPVRGRLVELLKIKESYHQFDERSKAAEREVVEEKRQLDEIEESITQLDMKIQRLMVEKEMKGSYVAELERKIDVTKERIRGFRLVFDGIVGSPLVSSHGK